MFDAHKLDISDELKGVMELSILHMDKIRVVLNKADTISTQQLMRVYGALMWSLGKVMNSPRVATARRDGSSSGYNEFATASSHETNQ
jgi:EH domain-containing protein 1